MFIIHQSHKLGK